MSALKTAKQREKRRSLTIRKGFKRLGGPDSSVSSGKALIKAALMPNAMQFSRTIPPAVGTEPACNIKTESVFTERSNKSGLLSYSIADFHCTFPECGNSFIL
jgi:hypothetical protein